MKEGFIHVCFVIDESGSMYPSRSDVIGGFQKVIDEQKSINTGKCAISLFTFSRDVKEVYIGTDVSVVDGLTGYSPCGGTAMNDGIGAAIDRIGAWISEMPESERPEQNLIVIMTDGEENCSTKYTLQKVKDMIRHQTEKYSWKFMYIGTDITTKKDSEALGIGTASYSTRGNYHKNYDILNSVTSSFRCSTGSTASKLSSMNSALGAAVKNLTEETEKKIGKKIE